MNIIDNAYQGKYNDFADEVKTELKTRLANHETVKNYTSVLQRIQDNQAAYKAIANRE